jgi:hypothetical protein
MDQWLELGRLYRRILCSAPSLGVALTGLQTGGSAAFRRVLDDRMDWPAATSGIDWEADARMLLTWLEDVRQCDLGAGVDIIYIDIGHATRTFEVSAWRWADRVMLIDEGLIEPDSVRTISSPGRTHSAEELPSPIFAGPAHNEFARLCTWLLFCSFVPIEALADSDMKSAWDIDRELAVVFASGDHVFHGGFVTPGGWRRPLRQVEAPAH